MPSLKQNPRRPAMPRRYDCPPQGRPRIWRFGSIMIAKLGKPGETCVFRHLAPIIGLLVAWTFVLSAVPARAQVNIDQGKSATEIFSNDCATCHKSAKGLANGKNSATLAGFLREHYTSSAQQAASLAAYVLGAGSGPPPSASLKPGTGGPKAGEAKPGEKPGARPEQPSSTAKLQQPSDQDTKVEAEPAAEPGSAVPGPAVPGPAVPGPAMPGRKPAGKREPRPVTASRGLRQEPENPPPAPQAAPIATPETAPVATAPAVTTPAATEPGTAAEPPPTTTAAAPSAAPEPGPAQSASTPSPDAGSSASAGAPADTSPSDSAPVPRDDISD